MEHLLEHDRPAAAEPAPKRPRTAAEPEPAHADAAAAAAASPSAADAAATSSASSAPDPSPAPSAAPDTAAASSEAAADGDSDGEEVPAGLRNDTATAAEREERAGITRFLGRARGFDGIMKLRFSDFLVNEIDEGGRVVRLTDVTSVPREAGEEGEAAEEQPPDDDAALRAGLAAVLGEEQTERIWRFMHDTPAELQSKARLVLPKEEDKEKRTEMHRAIKTLAASSTLPRIFSQTSDGCVVVCFQRNKAANNFGTAWPKTRPRYLWFVLTKENKDTGECVGVITRMLKKKPGMMQYAGTKDKRGVTTQLCSLVRVTAERMQQLHRGLQPFISVGNFRYEDRPLQLGMLKGNRFTIVLRNVQGEDEDIEQSLQDLKNFGFINYYGMQRFGTGPTSTDSVGLAVLKGRWKQAVNMLLQPGRKSTRAIQHYRETGDAKAALDMLRRVRGCHIESALLGGLARVGPAGFSNAFYELPRNMRLMYVHSYQSKVWNRMVSKRLELFGNAPVVGDLVLESDETDDEGMAVDADSDDVQIEEKRRDVPVRALTEEDVESGRYSLHDVVMPLPGHLVSYPPHMRAHYAAALADDGLHIDCLKQNTRELSLTGDYRRMVRQASDVEWKIMRYSKLERLVLSDADRVRGTAEPQDDPDGQFKAVVVSFSLPSSCYATMCLREAMKRSTTYSRDEAPHPQC